VSIETHSPTRERRFGRIRDAVQYAGVSRSGLYNMAKSHPGLFRKNGLATLVDFIVLDEILDALPAAELKARARKRT
jgi:hypothetical protein